MPAAARHAKPKTPAVRLRAPVLAPAGARVLAPAGVPAGIVASRHAKPKTPIRLRAPVVVPVVAAATLATAAAAFVALHGGSAVPASSHDAMAVVGTGTAFTGDRVTTVVRSDVGAGKAGKAKLAAKRAERAQQAAQQAHQAHQAAAAAPAPSAAPPPPVSGGDAADSALGVCIRNAEEGGSYAWGPGNGGGAYQFLLGTWETYGGAASEFGVAGPAYQDQIFDNAIAAGGASNWTAYDGC
ncbi:MAG TPA: hypothetical protein VLW44_09745 [Streptosporangiaceae bacterium]|nr:hypothetical protein [Streptosporangiaceae bacterium]